MKNGLALKGLYNKGRDAINDKGHIINKNNYNYLLSFLFRLNNKEL